MYLQSSSLVENSIGCLLLFKCDVSWENLPHVAQTILEKSINLFENSAFLYILLSFKTATLDVGSIQKQKCIVLEKGDLLLLYEIEIKCILSRVEWKVFSKLPPFEFVEYFCSSSPRTTLPHRN